MKLLKKVSLFLLISIAMLSLGFYIGVRAYQFFYPGENQRVTDGNKVPPISMGGNPSVDKMVVKQGNLEQEIMEQENKGQENLQQESVLAASQNNVVNADTVYILLETDVLTEESVEIQGQLPAKYFGMNREQFIQAMDEYEAFPPLVEMERGFVSLEVLSFSGERIVVQMNYQYIQPSACFYLAAINHEVVVLLENKETIYINTGIKLEDLPQELQTEIIQMKYVESEEKLYDFLEAYSS